MANTYQLSLITNHTPQPSRKFRKERGGYLILLCPHTVATHTFNHCEGSETVAKNDRMKESL